VRRRGRHFEGRSRRNATEPGAARKFRRISGAVPPFLRQTHENVSGHFHAFAL